jgi:uncharacterized protein (TIGR02679 family)
MSEPADTRIERLLGGPDLAELRRRLRKRYERARTGEDDKLARFRLGGLSRREYDALASLMGRPSRPAKSIEVDVAAINASLSRVGIAPSLKGALERLDGPIVHLATASAEAQARWFAAIGTCRHPSLARFLEDPRNMGLLKRLARQSPDTAAQLSEQADLVLRRLPGGGVPRAQLAAETLGNAHALDAGAPTATLVLAVLRLGGRPSEDRADDASEEMQSDERARAVWARFGVLVNELARPALFLNLPTGDGGFVGKPGDPAYASLRTLLRTAPALAVAGRTVYVCENPNIVAIAADRVGAHCAPLVCTEGMPAAAQRTLLARLVECGALLRYHGDFDWPGLRIANHVIATHGAAPWRFGAADYAAALETGSRQGQGLFGPATEAAWDEMLAPAMRLKGMAVAEEAVADLLILDLGGRQ